VWWARVYVLQLPHQAVLLLHVLERLNLASLIVLISKSSLKIARIVGVLFEYILLAVKKMLSRMLNNKVAPWTS